MRCSDGAWDEVCRIWRRLFLVILAGRTSVKEMKSE